MQWTQKGSMGLAIDVWVCVCANLFMGNTDDS